MRNPNTGTVHSSRPMGQRGFALTLCGMPWVDLFATYEYGTMWSMLPLTEPVTCQRCVASLSERGD